MRVVVKLFSCKMHLSCCSYIYQIISVFELYENSHLDSVFELYENLHLLDSKCVRTVWKVYYISNFRRHICALFPSPLFFLFVSHFSLFHVHEAYDTTSNCLLWCRWRFIRERSWRTQRYQKSDTVHFFGLNLQTFIDHFSWKLWESLHTILLTPWDKSKYEHKILS